MKFDNKDILIAVPSKGRHEGLKKHTFNWLQHTKYDYMVFVEPQDYDGYAEYVPKKNLFELPKNDQGLSYCKMFIKNYAEEKGYRNIFKMDDDTSKWTDPRTRGNVERRRTGGIVFKSTMKQNCEEVFEPLVEHCLKALEIPEVGAIAFKYRNEMRDYEETRTFDRTNCRLQSCFVTRTDLFQYIEGIHTIEDFLNFIDILKQGYITLRYSLSAMDYVLVGTNEGGIQSFDRRQRNYEDVMLATELYPEIVWKVVEGKAWDFEPDFRKMSKWIGAQDVWITI